MPVHRGKLATHPDILAVRPLTREDLKLLTVPRTPGDPTRTGSGAVARFRDSHHRIARLFAMGLRVGEVVARAGYSHQRVYLLHADPAFQELIAKYRDKVDAAWLAEIDEFYETSTANMRKAERMIADRLDRADEEDIEIPLKTLVDISADRMDRFGYGKRQTNINVNSDFAASLEAAITRSGKATVIEATATQPQLQSPSRVAPPLPSMESPALALNEGRPQTPKMESQSADVPLRRRA